MDVITVVAIKTYRRKYGHSKENIRVGMNAGKRVVWLGDILWKGSVDITTTPGLLKIMSVSLYCQYL